MWIGDVEVSSRFDLAGCGGRTGWFGGSLGQASISIFSCMVNYCSDCLRLLIAQITRIVSGQASSSLWDTPVTTNFITIQTR